MRVQVRHSRTSQQQRGGTPLRRPRAARTRRAQANAGPSARSDRGTPRVHPGVRRVHAVEGRAHVTSAGSSPEAPCQLSAARREPPARAADREPLRPRVRPQPGDGDEDPGPEGEQPHAVKRMVNGTIRDALLHERINGCDCSPSVRMLVLDGHPAVRVGHKAALRSTWPRCASGSAASGCRATCSPAVSRGPTDDEPQGLDADKVRSSRSHPQRWGDVPAPERRDSLRRRPQGPCTEGRRARPVARPGRRARQ